MKIGVGIITCERYEMFRKCLLSIPFEKVSDAIIVNDSITVESRGRTESLAVECSKEFRIEVQHTDGSGVGVAKNAALKYLLDAGCDYIFLVEDDMLIKRDDIFDAYIAASEATGIQHMMFAYHGPANKNNISGGPPCPRLTVKYSDNLSITLNMHCVGAFCMYTRGSLQTVGLFNTEFNNAFEHIHHSYLLCKNNFCTAYWWWPDLANSLDYIEEQACSENSSSIRPRKDWITNINKGYALFQKLEGVSPIEVHDETESFVLNKLRALAHKL